MNKEFANSCNSICSVSTITDDGAWCWFADPRAIHNVNTSTGSDKTYIGYIDISGNIKALQYDNKTKECKEVLVRAEFQADDHNSPTFLVIPDGRVMIFYSEHTSSPYFYYRITCQPDDITTFGPEKAIDTTGYGNTTYPCPYIMSDQPGYFYLLWRGVNWHPTVARFTLPDQNGDVAYDISPKQIVDSRVSNSDGGKRPYAKYESNSRDKIFITYTYTHPDNINPNSLYYSYLDVNNLTLHDANGKQLANVNTAPLKLYNNETDPAYLVDRQSDERNWNWDIAVDQDERPVILFVRINEAKDSHEYYYAKWTGLEWRLTKLADGGRWFHQNEKKEYCYSGGMTLDHDNTSVVYMSIPVPGQYGNVYEIIKCVIGDDGSIIASEQITLNSTKNNVRPFVIRNASINDQFYLIWMYGDYYYWDNTQGRLGYTTGLKSSFRMGKK